MNNPKDADAVPTDVQEGIKIEETKSDTPVAEAVAIKGLLESDGIATIMPDTKAHYEQTERARQLIAEAKHADPTPDI